MNLRIRLENLAHCLQDCVTDRVAVNIINCLEVVQIEHGKRVVAVGAVPFEILLHRSPVEHPRQCVALGDVL